MIGTFATHHAWASWAASGAVLSAIYLLWAYQRVALGEVTVEKNRTLPDASTRERIILVTMALVIIFMGVASPLFTQPHGGIDRQRAQAVQPDAGCGAAAGHQA